MTQKQDSKGELRAAFAQRELTNAKNSLSEGVPGLIVRAALVTLFMSLLMVAYLVMGAPGLAFVNSLFLVALLTPLFAKVFRKLRSGRKENKAQANTELTPEVQNEG